MSSKISTHKFLSEVSKAVEVLGEDRTLDALRIATKNDSKKKHIEFVINMVCNRLDFKPSEISKRNKIMKRIIVVRFICYYAYMLGKPIGKKQKEGIWHTDIAVILDRRRGVVADYCLEMVAKKKDKTDTYHQNHFKYFDAQIKKYMKTMYSNSSNEPNVQGSDTTDGDSSKKAK